MTVTVFHPATLYPTETRIAQAPSRQTYQGFKHIAPATKPSRAKSSHQTSYQPMLSARHLTKTDSLIRAYIALIIHTKLLIYSIHVASPNAFFRALPTVASRE
ncbi:hypothetical protein K474DRAFT_821493 [Panus rudis PR-1116 ss-1]|nr:hypothetical protein K474DRAFT_821493 [Panus rudis PR-1116 ss-1]